MLLKILPTIDQIFYIAKSSKYFSEGDLSIQFLKKEWKYIIPLFFHWGKQVLWVLFGHFQTHTKPKYFHFFFNNFTSKKHMLPK